MQGTGEPSLRCAPASLLLAQAWAPTSGAHTAPPDLALAAPAQAAREAAWGRAIVNCYSQYVMADKSAYSKKSGRKSEINNDRLTKSELRNLLHLMHA